MYASAIGCDLLFPGPSSATYINEALNQHSYIDYILTTCQNVYDFAVLEPDVNFSDHYLSRLHCQLKAAIIHL